MPLSGTLEADFSEFLTETAKAVEGLKALTAQAATTTEALAKMGEGKSPAVEKTKELGTELKKIPSAFESIGKAAQALGIAVTLERAVTLTIDFWKETLAVADGFKNIADQTGMAASEVARLDAVAKGAGLQVEDLAKASAKLQAAFETEKGLSAIGRLGIDARELKAADPYTQLQMVARGLGEITDRSERLLFQQDLLGSNSAKLARVMNDTFADTANAAKVASDESIAAVAALGNKYTEIKSTLIAFATEGLGSILRAADDLRALDWKAILQAAALSTTTAEMIANLRLLREQQEAVALMAGGGPKPWLEEPAPVGPTHEQIAEANAARKKLIADQESEWDAYVKSEQKRQAEIGEAQARVNEARRGGFAVLLSLTSATRAQVEADLKLGASQDDIAKSMGLSKVQVKAVADELDRQKQSAEGVVEANKIVTEETTKFYRESADQAATSLQQQTLAIGSWQADAMAKLAATGEASEAQYAAIATIADEKLAAVGVNWDTLREGSIQTLRDQYTAAERTYTRMLAASDDYTPKAIANAKKERDARLGFLAEVDSSVDKMYTAWLAREAAFATAVEGHDKTRAAAAGTAADAASAAMDQAIAYAQAYGVSLEAAQKALGQLPPEAEKLPPIMERGAAATGRMVVQMQQLRDSVRSAWEEMAAGNALMEAYREAGVATGTQIAVGGYNFQNLLRTGVMPTYGTLERPDLTTPWGTGRGATETTNTLNINVNSTDAKTIADRLVAEMKHQGVRV